MLRYALAFLVASSTFLRPAVAGVDEALETEILPGYTTFATSAQALNTAAQTDCRPEAVRPPWNAAFDAWMSVAHLRLGPGETASPSIAFWPDERGTIPRALTRMIEEEDPIVDTNFHEVSIAARGLFALEQMLYGDFSTYEEGGYACRLVRAMTADLAEQAAELERAWRDGYAGTLRTAGQADNVVYLSSDEALKALYTQLLTGIEFVADQRLGRPMGSFERPRPARAEAWRSGRSARNVTLSLEALLGLARALADGPIPETEAAFAAALSEAARLTDPGFQDVTDPQIRFRLESLQQRVRAARAAVEEEIGAPLGIQPGFNSLDGD